MNVERIRKMLKLTQKRFAEEIGVSPITVCRWERKQRKVSNLAIERIKDLIRRKGFERQIQHLK
jgi:DNA-binding transcriptional regulator YiaG